MTNFPDGSAKRDRVRVFISAYACNPNRGSEHGTGWKVAWELAREFEVHILTRTKNREDIQSFLGPDQGSTKGRTITVHYFELPNPLPQVKSRGWLPLSIYYTLWQVGAFVWAKRNFPVLSPQICHHLTFNSFEFPSLWRFFSIPTVLGPLGGGQIASPSLLSFMGVHCRRERLRSVRIKFSAANPLVRAGLSRAKAVIFANDETRERLERYTKSSVYEMVDVGVDCVKFVPAPSSPSRVLQLLYVGKMEARKGIWILPFIARYLAESKIAFQMILLGDGPELDALRSHFGKSFDAQTILFRGCLGHAETVQSYQAADFLLFPSIRDTSGAVVLEALACGCPVVCFRHQGAAWMVTDECGVLIDDTKLNSLEAIAAAFANAATTRKENAPLHQAMRTNASQRAKLYFSWSVKADKVAEIYRSCLAGGVASPDISSPGQMRASGP